MFATLLGALPSPDPGATRGDVDDAIRTAIAAQEEAGLEPLTDGRLRDQSFEQLIGDLLGWKGPDHAAGVVARVVEGWRFAAACTSRGVKQALPGPYTVGRRLVAPDGRPAVDASARREASMAVALLLRRIVEALAAAGCPLVEIEERELSAIGASEVERSLFGDAHRRLADGVGGTHLTLSIVGGSGWDAGLETIAAAPYGSLAVDLIAGPDNWNLVTRLPADRGIIAGALPAQASPADTREMLLWAARYAAASNGRGIDRVGLGSAGSWAGLGWDEAVVKLGRLGDAARLAATPAGEGLARQIDPRAVSARAAAMGQLAPRRARRRRPDRS